MQQLAADPLQLPADRQLPGRQVDGILGQAEHLALAQAEHQDQHSVRLSRRPATHRTRRSLGVRRPLPLSLCGRHA
ncbi:hypothetical protein AB0J85_20405 [Micromonospora echinofusca]|uniref:hypothetical protein n=1 Tax=Micromonospora echinofusca TaxID=47858 RepID=UPI00343F8493